MMPDVCVREQWAAAVQAVADKLKPLGGGAVTLALTRSGGAHLQVLPPCQAACTASPLFAAGPSPCGLLRIQLPRQVQRAEAWIRA